MGAFAHSYRRRSPVSAWRRALRPSAELWFHRRALLLLGSDPSGIVASRDFLRRSTRKAGVGYSYFSRRSAERVIPRF